MSAKGGKNKLTRERILEAVESGADTMSQVVRALGYRSVCGSTTSRIRSLVPDIGERLGGSKEGPAKAVAAKAPTKRAARPKKTPKAKPQKKAARTEYPRADSNPFREGSAYATGYDILAHAGEAGIERGRWTDELARLMPLKEGESEESRRRRAGFNVTVLASSRESGESHRCISNHAADVYYCARSENGGSWLKLVLRDRKY